jgi:hypothetical protein
MRRYGYLIVLTTILVTSACEDPKDQQISALNQEKQGLQAQLAQKQAELDTAQKAENDLLALRQEMATLQTDCNQKSAKLKLLEQTPEGAYRLAVEQGKATTPENGIKIYREYLVSFPKSPFASDVQKRIDEEEHLIQARDFENAKYYFDIGKSVVRWIWATLFFPIVVFGILFYGLYVLIALVRKRRIFFASKRWVFAILPPIVSVFVLSSSAEQSHVTWPKLVLILSDFLDTHVMQLLPWPQVVLSFAGLLLGFLLLESGRYLTSLDSEIPLAIFCLFLSSALVSVVLCFFEEHFAIFDWCICGAIIGSAVDYVCFYRPAEISSARPSRKFVW